MLFAVCFAAALKTHYMFLCCQVWCWRENTTLNLQVSVFMSLNAVFTRFTQINLFKQHVRGFGICQSDAKTRARICVQSTPLPDLNGWSDISFSHSASHLTVLTEEHNIPWDLSGAAYRCSRLPETFVGVSRECRRSLPGTLNLEPGGIAA